MTSKKISRKEIESDPRWVKMEKTFFLDTSISKEEQEVQIANLKSALDTSGHQVGYYIESKPPKPGYNRVMVDFDLKSQWYYKEIR